jgi:hypothetical protein
MSSTSAASPIASRRTDRTAGSSLSSRCPSSMSRAVHTCSLTHQSCGMEPGETIAETIVREVREETGIEATVEKLLGVYSNPRHVSVYDDGEVR